jgi:nucleotide-binding universal stress UspA family protein
MLIPTNILVPTDFSKYSDIALNQALHIAREYKSKVLLLHVIEDKISYSIEDHGQTLQSIRRIETHLVSAAHKRLKKQIDKFPAAKGVEVVSELAKGVPSEEILRAQKEKGVDLIVLSSLGTTGLAKYFIGSVARNVLKGSACTVLLTKQEMLRPSKILVPTDFSDYSDKALKQALDIAKQYDANVFLLHVIPKEVNRCVADVCLGDDVIRDIENQITTRAQEDLQRQVSKFPQSTEVSVTSEIGKGTPYDAILQVAEEKGIDLIVIASLGRSGIARFLIGSVARNVLKGAKCPVLLTK